MAEIIQLDETDIDIEKVTQGLKEEQKKPKPEDNKKQKEVQKEIAKAEKQEDEMKEDADKAKRLTVLSKYRNSKRFGPYLKEIGCNLDPTRLVKLSVKQLDHLLLDVKMKIATKSSSGLAQEMVFKGIGMLEFALHDLWRIDKLSDTLRNSESFLDTIEELLLEWDGAYMSPKLRCVVEILSTAVLVHNTHEFAQELIKHSGGKEKLKQILEERGKTQNNEVEEPRVKIDFGPEVPADKLSKYSNLINVTEQ